MKLKSLKLSHDEISYFEVEKESPSKTLLFIHGNSCSKNVWKKQLNDPRFSSFRLIALDLSGHGDSRKREDGAKNSSIYTLDFHKNVILEFILKLHLENVILIGHSLGGHVAARVLPHSKNVSGLLIFGTPPLETLPDVQKGFNPVNEMGYLFSPSATREQLQGLSKVFGIKEKGAQEGIISDFLKADPFCRVNLALSLNPNTPFGEMTAITHFKNSIALLAATNDSLINLDYLDSLPKGNFWRNDIIICEGGHFLQLDVPELFNQKLLEYIHSLP